MTKGLRNADTCRRCKIFGRSFHRFSTTNLTSRRILLHVQCSSKYANIRLCSYLMHFSDINVLCAPIFWWNINMLKQRIYYQRKDKFWNTKFTKVRITFLIYVFMQNRIYNKSIKFRFRFNLFKIIKIISSFNCNADQFHRFNLKQIFAAIFTLKLLM